MTLKCFLTKKALYSKVGSGDWSGSSKVIWESDLRTGNLEEQVGAYLKKSLAEL